MKCNHCGADVNPGVPFCGTCGQQLLQVGPVPVMSGGPSVPIVAPNPISPISPVAPGPQPPTSFANNINPVGYTQPVGPPGYSPVMAGGGGMMAAPQMTSYSQIAANGTKNTKAIIAMVLGILGLVGWLIPIVGCLLGIAAIVLGTTSLRQPHRAFAIAGIVLAVPVLALSIFAWVKNVQAVQTTQQKSGVSLPSNAVSASGSVVDTPCYKANLGAEFTITQGSDSCTVKATNASGSDVYNIKGLVSPYKANELESVSQQDIKHTLDTFPGSKVTGQKSASFAGSNAYHYTFSIPSPDEVGTAAYIRHESVNGINTFVVIRETSGTDASLQTVESSWQWKK